MKNLLLCLTLALSVSGLAAVGRSDWEKSFLHPPASARPWVYWFWLNGNITSNGITADLEAMKRVGIGGVLIMEVDQGTPKGTAAFGTPGWRELFKHVCGEAHRLGLEVNMNNDAGWCGSGGPWITPDLAMQKIVWAETNVDGPRHVEMALPNPIVVSNYYRDITVLAFPTPASPAQITDIEGKAAFVPRHIPITGTFPRLGSDKTIPRERIINIGSGISTNGQLIWDVPPGKWTILRIGHTMTGKDNHPAPEPGRGLESDKLSKTATHAMFEGLMAKLAEDSKPLVGKTLVSTHIDSWETGSQNWTPRFREEFRAHRGYDLFPFLPVITGRVVESLEVSERFLWDVRQTISDLLIENYAGEFRKLAHQHGLRLSIEAYDGTPCDDMTYAGQADEPMAEFWSWGYNTAYSCVEMSSAAHVYGKRILGAEAFTANDQEKWLHHPATIKTLGDWAFCEGINRFVFHRYALQPWADRQPGMSMGPWGLHYERTQTWWEQSAAWHEYLARCQFLLRQGTFVADICFLEPEGSPMRFTPTMPWRDGNTPERPRYNFDGCTPEVVLNRMKVRDGRLVLPDGMSYRLLVLPQVETMTPKLLRKIKALSDAGAIIVGPPPRKSPSLADYPLCDQEVQRLADKLWNAGKVQDGIPRVIWGDGFKTFQTTVDWRTSLAEAKWIWHHAGNPAASAPPGKCYFRFLLPLSPARPIASARFSLTVDNSFELWVNGKSAGTGDNFKRLYDFDVKPLLKEGTNVLAVAGSNAMDYPNPAGFIGVLRLKFQNGTEEQINTDSKWESTTNSHPGWMTETNLQGWTAAMELGRIGMQPWGELDMSSSPPYVFPVFAAISGVLKNLGVAPDFEADPSLRFIHRRQGPTDFYFVANSQTNWIQATCAFRVSGKRPELWDPLTGHVTRVAVFEEKDGRTFVPLSFEPAGSVFVVFREPSRSSNAKETSIVEMRRDGQEIVPGLGKGLPGPAPVTVSVDREERIQALVWQPGRYELKSAAGKTHSFDVPNVPAPLALQGPWEVEFQAGRGAPAKTTMDSLTDWSQHTNDGIKYFSGTATYRKSFTLPGSTQGRRQRTFLDLGNVMVMAQVNLNGKPLGTLWKPPYKVEITDAVKPGENVLEIKVVNLWVNRLIGDEELPEDSERNSDGTLKQWPQWLVDNKPSPAGRYSFTSWRLWKKASPLQPSGLLGPATIVTAREIQVLKPAE